MNQLASILFHMDFMNTNCFFPLLCLYLYLSVTANRQIQLRYLIILRIVWIKVILSVKLAVLCNFTICSKSYRHGILYYLLIQNGQRTWHTCTYRTGVCIWSSPKLCGTGAKYFCFCGQFDMNFKAYNCFILFHNLAFSLSKGIYNNIFNLFPALPHILHSFLSAQRNRQL